MPICTAAAIAAPVSEEISPDAALVALGARWEAVMAEWDTAEDVGNSEIEDAIGERERILFGEITAIRATTPAGLAVKARLMLRAMDCEDRTLAGIAAAGAEHQYNGEKSAFNLAADILRLEQASVSRDPILQALALAEAPEAEQADTTLLAMREPWLAARAAIREHELKRSPVDQAEAAAVIATLPSADDAADADDLARIMRLRSETIDRLPPYPAETDEEQESREDRLAQACRRENRIIDRLADMPAHTLAGIAFKAEVARANDHMEPRLAASAMADVEALAGGTAADQDPLTLDDYANGEFEPCFATKDLEELRPAFDRSWSPLAFAMMILTKTKDEVVQLAQDMEGSGDGKVLTDFADSVEFTRQWFAKTVVFMESAEARLMSGICHAARAAGVSIDGR